MRPALRSRSQVDLEPVSFSFRRVVWTEVCFDIGMNNGSTDTLSASLISVNLFANTFWLAYIIFDQFSVNTLEEGSFLLGVLMNTWFSCVLFCFDTMKNCGGFVWVARDQCYYSLVVAETSTFLVAIIVRAIVLNFCSIYDLGMQSISYQFWWPWPVFRVKYFFQKTFLCDRFTLCVSVAYISLFGEDCAQQVINKGRLIITFPDWAKASL